MEGGSSCEPPSIVCIPRNLISRSSILCLTKREMRFFLMSWTHRHLETLVVNSAPGGFPSVVVVHYWIVWYSCFPSPVSPLKTFHPLQSNAILKLHLEATVVVFHEMEREKESEKMEKRSNLLEHILSNEEKINLSLGTYTLWYRSQCGFMGGWVLQADFWETGFSWNGSHRAMGLLQKYWGACLHHSH